MFSFNRAIISLAIFSTVARMYFFFNFQKESSSLAPDEGTYASLSSWVSQGLQTESFQGYDESFYLSIRGFILPASMLVRAGMDPLDSVRLISSIFGLMASLLLGYVILKVKNEMNSLSLDHRKYHILLLSCYVVYLFLPSHFLWSVLGLRESATEFLVMVCILSITNLLRYQEVNYVRNLFLFSIGIFYLFSVRPQIGWITSLSVLGGTIFLSKKRLKFISCTIVLVSVALGHAASLGFSTQDRLTITSNEILGIYETNEQGEEIFLAVPECIQNEAVKVGGSEFMCEALTETRAVNAKNFLTGISSEFASLDRKKTVNSLEAQSAIPLIGCPLKEGSRTSEVLCLVWRTPYNGFTVLFRPLFPGDFTSGPSRLAGIENLGWLGMILFMIYLISQKSISARSKQLVPSSCFFVLFTLGAAAYEGNMGTAFRHKSLVLPTVLLMIILLWESSSRFKRAKK